MPQEAPTPDADARRHSATLVDRIRAAAEAAGGVLRFDQYMAMALYEPGLGYYSAGQARFGTGGDYITAPLASTLFSRTLANQCAEVLNRLGGGDVLEFGAGTGRMAADVLTELAALQCLPKRYRILEVSAALRQEQATAIAELPADIRERVEWLEHLPDEPFQGVVLANEVMDALPVRRFQIAEDGIHELAVTHDGENFQYRLMPADDTLTVAIRRIEADLDSPLPPGYVSEYCPTLPGWMQALAGCLDAGAALLIDYGYPRREYYHRQRAMGTLLCHYRHRAHDDAFWWPGLQDITASVDFTAAARAATEAGLELQGFTTQANFLMGAGLPGLLEAEMNRDPQAAAVASQQAKPLLMPGEMGERFKVLAVGRGLSAPLTGFGFADQSGRLNVHRRHP